MRRRRSFAYATFLIATLLFSLTMPGISRAKSAATSFNASTSYADRYGIASSQLTDLDATTMDHEFQDLNGVGAGWVRCGFSWVNLEPVQGWWNPERLACADRLVSEAEDHEVNVLGILGCTPYWANGGKTWNYPPTDIAAWRNYVRTIVTRYRGRVKAWEVWNEENIQIFWGDPPSPAAYMPILIAASEEIRAADPDALILMGGLAGGWTPSFDYLTGCLSLGLANYVDVINYHPYPETLGTGEYTPQEVKCRWIVDYMRYLMAQGGAADLQLWITEFSFTTSQWDQETQAIYMLRSLINYARTDLEMIFWYRLRDTGSELSGLVEEDFDRKRSYSYYTTFTDVFGDVTAFDPSAASFSCARMDTLEADCFRKNNGRLLIAAWKTDDLDDSFNLTISDPAYKSLIAIDPETGARQPCAASIDAYGRLAISGMAIGKKPVILEASMSTDPDAYGNAFYFAEGYTGQGFEEWLCLANPNAQATTAHVTYMFSDGTTQTQDVPIGGTTRQTVYVNDAVGAGKDVSIKVTSDSPIVCERPMYFNYKGGWTGGHDVVGYAGEL
ncbi:MAG: hypothetical protein A2Y75_12090 [Candidatus Solincola sediminis]|uniref:Glycoside hydrolase family 5 domain-containing protein n=1 Tax=Candidatus Solincola sediminis TaxID=1797199 RepID=A0A1F2WM83_9ACTN|nr:MAG: hypothetical protein A2Y75_12090 [Candidatus Solincola sediminis]